MNQKTKGNYKMRFVLISSIVLLLFSIYNCLALDVPVAVIEKEVVAVGHEEKRSNGSCKKDGKPTYTYYTDSQALVHPEVGDLFSVEWAEGWRLTFWNVGEGRGETTKIAKLEGTIEHFSASEIVTEVQYTDYEINSLPFTPNVNSKPYNENTIRQYSKVKKEPVNIQEIPAYYRPEEVYTLAFTGGPNGVFYELDGIKQHSTGGAIRGDVKKDESTGLYYVQFTGPINVRLNISDPAVFEGYQELKENQNLIIEENYAYGFTDFKGDVEVEYEDGDAEGPEAFLFSTNINDKKVIPPGATIKTGRNSYVVINFQDEADFILGPNSQLTIKKPEEGFFNTAKGQVLMNIKKNLTQMIRDGSLDVTMNQAVSSRKGTTAVFVESEGVSTVKVLEGAISFKSIATGEAKDVLPGETISADQNGLSELKKFSIKDELKQWEKTSSKESIDKIRAYINAETKSIGSSNKSFSYYIWIFIGVIALFIIVMLYRFLLKKKVSSDMKD